MGEKKVFLVDDNDDYRKFLKDLLTALGFSVVLEAGRLAEALEAIRGGKLQEKEVNIAIVDGNLDPKELSCRHGQEIDKAIKETGLSIKVVAFTAAENPGYGDIHFSKGATPAVKWKKLLED